MKLLNFLKCLFRLHKVALLELTFFYRCPQKDRRQFTERMCICWQPVIIDNADVMDDLGMNLYRIADKMKFYSNPKYRNSFIVKELSKLGLDTSHIEKQIDGEDVYYMTYSADYLIGLFDFKIPSIKKGDIPTEKFVLDTYYTGKDKK